MEVQLKKASKENIAELRKICIDCYSIYFGNHWNENGLEWYLDKQFNLIRLKTDLKNTDVDYYFINIIDVPVGFIKINYNSVSNLVVDPCSELEKMYVLPKYKGKGIGKMAMRKVMNITQKKGRKILFLDVLDTNKNAIAFYEKLGFSFHCNNRLDLPYFKDHLRGIDRMFIKLNKSKTCRPILFHYNPQLWESNSNSHF